MDPEEIKAIASASLPNALGLLKSWFPLGKLSGKEFSVGNLQGAAGKSLSVNIVTGKWCDLATNERGGDLVSLLAAKEGITQSQAAEALDPNFGTRARSEPKTGSKANQVIDNQGKFGGPEYTVLAHAPADAPPIPAHRVYGAANGLWTYRNTSGAVIGYVCRFDTAEGKQYAPISWCRNGVGESWQFKAFGRPRPLYRLELLADAKDEVILLVEGEKTCDAAQRLFPEMICMTWPGGAKAVNYCDFEPLKGKKVVIWPDNDEPGRDAAAKLTTLVAGSRVVKLPDGLPDGWDLADEVPDGVDLRGLIAATLNPPSDVLTIPQIMALQSDEGQYRFGDGGLGKGELNSVTGPGGVGKTRAMVCLALNHAAGRPYWMGQPLKGQLSYLFIGSENHPQRIKADLIGLSKGFGKLELEHAAERVKFCLPSEYPDSHGGFLDEDAGFKWLLGVVKANPADVLVFDTLASLCLSSDLNKDVDMRQVIGQVFKLMAASKPGCSGLIIHHARPGSENIKQSLDRFSGGSYGRNSKVLANLCRAQFNLLPGDAQDFNRIVLTVGKMNNGRPFDPIGIRWRDEVGYEADPDFVLEDFKNDVGGKLTGSKFTVLDVLETIEAGKHQAKDIIEDIESRGLAKRPTIWKRIDDAKSKGYIEGVMPRGNYILTDKGLSCLRS